MARAHFQFAIGPEGRQPGSWIQAGDVAEGTIVVRSPDAHTGVKVHWNVGWVARGRSTDRLRVGSGTHVIGNLVAGIPEVVRVRCRIPSEGPISYQGSLLSIRWHFQAILDIPWTTDPASEVNFEVRPRQAAGPAPQRVQGGPTTLVYPSSTRPGSGFPLVRAQARASSRETCPFCRDGIQASDRMTCPRCETPHHPECFSLYGRCTIPGCG